jgi:WD40 repeat protein
VVLLLKPRCYFAVKQVNVIHSLTQNMLTARNYLCSGWNDGQIRAFTPQTGRLIYEIINAHNAGVTAIAITTCGQRIVSGGSEGQVSDPDVCVFTNKTS